MAIQATEVEPEKMIGRGQCQCQCQLGNGERLGQGSFAVWDLARSGRDYSWKPNQEGERVHP